ncbi:MAG: hypothetical protein JRJ29_04825 [Deltaproteobacteria bacterium]|nr:hypothetical protein [Deltaproteobacteria bacterium]
MDRTLGIYVSSDDQLDRLIDLCQAAKNKGVNVTVFLTHIGTRLTQESRFGELVGLAKIFVCKVGFEANNLKRPVAGLEDRAYASQSQNAEIIHDCDKYITF